MSVSKVAFKLTPEIVAAAQEAAAEYGVSPEISDHDQLLGYMVTNASAAVPLAVKDYFRGGSGDAHSVFRVIRETGNLENGKSILEFAAGFGRVTRHLKHLLHDDQLVASDIHDSACQLIQQSIGTKAFVSSTNPGELNVGKGHDFIFVLSLFSHLPDHSFGPWLAALYELLAPGGSLMFTTHGEAALRVHPGHFGLNYDEARGFGYRPESDQQDLDAADYGTAVVSMTYVYEQIRRHTPAAHISSFRAFKWFGLQDEWIVRRPPAG